MTTIFTERVATELLDSSGVRSVKAYQYIPLITSDKHINDVALLATLIQVLHKLN